MFPRERWSAWKASAADHSVHQMLECQRRVAALAGMHRRRLHDGALRGDQPVKSLALGEFADLPGLRPAGADRGNGCQRLADQLEVHIGVEREQRRFIELDAPLQYPLDIA